MEALRPLPHCRGPTLLYPKEGIWCHSILVEGAKMLLKVLNAA
jgi:hypothetical protein